MIMKRKLTYYVSALLFGAVSLFAACSDEEALTPSGNDLNMFAVDENDHSPEAELRRQFFKDTGVYLFFTDTLRVEQNGVDANGRPIYNATLINMNYNLSGEGGYDFVEYSFLETLEEKERAVEVLKDIYLPHLSPSVRPYSILVYKTLEDDYYTDLTSPSNIYCTGIVLGDVMSQSDEELEETMHYVLKDYVLGKVNALPYDDYMAPFENLVEANEGYLGELIPEWDRTQDEQLWALGFLSYDEDWYDEYYYDEVPSYNDWEDFCNLVMDNTEEEIEEQYGEYSLILSRCQIVREAILAVGYVY